MNRLLPLLVVAALAGAWWLVAGGGDHPGPGALDRGADVAELGGPLPVVATDAPAPTDARPDARPVALDPHARRWTLVVDLPRPCAHGVLAVTLTAVDDGWADRRDRVSLPTTWDDLAPGRYVVTANGLGWEGAEVDVALGPDGGTEHVVIEPRSRLTFAGRVVDAADGSPVRDFDLALRARWSKSRTDRGETLWGGSFSVEGGRFLVEGIVPPYSPRSDEVRVHVSAPGFVDESTGWMPRPDGDRWADVTVALRRESRVRGRVRTADGLPAEDAWVNLHDVTDEPVTASSGFGGPGSFAWSGRPHGGVRTDADGWFDITTDAPRRFTVSAWKEGCAAWMSEPLELRKPGDVVTVEGELPPAGSIRGTVTRGGASADLLVERADGGPSLVRAWWGTLRDEDGRECDPDPARPATALVDGLPAGRYAVRLLSRRGAQWEQHVLDEREVEVVAGRETAVRFDAPPPR